MTTNNEQQTQYEEFEGYELHINDSEYISQIGKSKLFVTCWDQCYDLWYGETKKNAKYAGRVYGTYVFNFEMVPYSDGEKIKDEVISELKAFKMDDVESFNQSQNICTLRIDVAKEEIQFLLNR